MAKIKDNHIFLTLLAKNAHPKLVELLAWMIFVKGYEVVATSFFRKTGSGVHSTDPVRAIDIRSWIYQDSYAVAYEINSDWIYDNTRPDLDVALLHDVGSGMHFHLQVHRNTEFVGDPTEWAKVQRIIAEDL